MKGELTAEPIVGVSIRSRPDSVIVGAWPLVVITAGMPLMFLLGLQGLIWAVPGVVLSARILRVRSTRVPGGALFLLIALSWMLASVVQVKKGGVPLFGYRWLLFVGAFSCEVWIANTSEGDLPTERVVRWLGSLWVAMVAFGLAAVMFTVDMPSPILRVLPSAISRIDFFESISAWRLAEVQGFLGFPLHRPAAPFPAANGWGSAMGLLFPFFVSSWIVGARRERRMSGILIMMIASVPIVYSFNRGLWLSIGLCVIYVTIRQVLRGRARAIAMFLGLAGLVWVTMTMSPLGDLADKKVSTAEDSNDARSEVYDGAIAGAKASPLLGNGAPKATIEGLPPIGTHGMVWYLIFVHGFVVAFLYIVWLVIEVIRSAPSRDPGSLWFHTALLVALMQTMFYGMLPQVVLVGIVAGLARRAAQNGRVGAATHNHMMPATLRS